MIERTGFPCQAGRPEFLLMNNEYGLGKETSLVNFTRFSKSLVAVEFALEMYVRVMRVNKKRVKGT